MLLISTIASLYVHTILHELGHLEAGLLSGYKFSSFRIAGKCDEAKELYTKALRKYIAATSSFMSRHRLMYAYYTLMEKDTDKAEKELQKFNKIKKTSPYKADVETEEELIGAIK